MSPAAFSTTPLSRRGRRTGLPWRTRLRWRRLAALALVLLAAVLALQGRGTSRAVWVFRAALPAGHVMTAEDLRSHSVPASLAPPNSIADPELAVGAALVSAVGAGEILTDTRILSDADRDENTRLVSITLADPGVLELVHEGSVVDIVGVGNPSTPAATAINTGPGSPEVPPISSTVVVESVTVADVPRDRHGEPRGTVAVSVERESAAQLAAASLNTPLTISIAG